MHDVRAPWRTPVLATVAADGAPRARTVVLRGLDRAKARLTVHSDIRAAKIADIRTEPRVALLFWDPSRRLQLRVEGRAEIETGAERCGEAWSRLGESQRALYAEAAVPGTPLEAAGARVADAAGHLALLDIAVARLEWLWLGRDHHVRGDSRREGARWVGRALVP